MKKLLSFYENKNIYKKYKLDIKYNFYNEKLYDREVLKNKHINTYFLYLINWWFIINKNIYTSKEELWWLWNKNLNW